MKKSILTFLFASIVLTTGLKAKAVLDTAIPNTNNRISRGAMLEHNGVLYIGGDFTEVGGQPRSKVAAIDLKNGQVLPWDPKIDPKKASVSCIVELGGNIYIGGRFKEAGGIEVSNLIVVRNAREGNGELNKKWLPKPDGSVLALLVGRAGVIYAAGRFDEICGKTRHKIAALRPASRYGAELTDWAPEFDRWVASLIRDPSDPKCIIASGLFKSVNGEKRELVTKLSERTGLVEGPALVFEGGPARQVMRLLAHRGFVYAVGVEIDTVNAKPRKNAFCILPGKMTLTGFKADISAGAAALTALNDRIYIGGDFVAVNGVKRRVAALNWRTGEVLPWNPLPSHCTYALLASGQTIYMSGYWKNLLGSERADFFAAVLDTEIKPENNYISQMR